MAKSMPSVLVTLIGMLFAYFIYGRYSAEKSATGRNDMRIVFAKDYAALSEIAADMVAEQIRTKPDSVVGLATGNTPLGMYRELIKIHRQKQLSFCRMVTFNLDEYIALGKEDPHSYHYYMEHHFFRHVDIPEANQHIPNGEAGNIEQECLAYEQKIKEAGGIDLQILGIGRNGHIGFNEPDVRFTAATHRAELAESTIRANSHCFSSLAQVPRFAISMGIKTIMQARSIVILVNGEDKAEVLDRALWGDISPEIPASILQLHQRVTVIVEENAAKRLRMNQRWQQAV